MNHLLRHGALLAEGSPIDSLSSGFRGRHARIETEDVVTGLLILGGIILIAWGLSYVLRIQDRRRKYTSPTGLFLTLCKAHRLRWSKRWLLWRVARSVRLRDPARVFLEPQWLDAEKLGPRFQSRAEELEQLRDRLFAEPEPALDEPDLRPAEAPEARQAGTPLSPPDGPPALDVPPWRRMSPSEMIEELLK